jgi:hypothetical protein
MMDRQRNGGAPARHYALANVALMMNPAAAIDNNEYADQLGLPS